MRNQQNDGYKDKACLNVTIKIGDPPPQGRQGAHSETWCLDYSSHPFPAFVFLSPTQVHLFWNLEETFSHHPATCFFPVFSICIAVICPANCLPCIVPRTTLIYLRFTSPLDRDLEASALTGFFFALARCVRTWSQEVLVGGFWKCSGRKRASNQSAGCFLSDSVNLKEKNLSW